MKYNFVYKTINLINDKSYIGVHSTDNLNDGYIGSGVKLKLAIKKHGKKNFKMIPIKFFNSIEDAYNYESILVTEEWVKSKNNYNVTIGGNGGFHHIFSNYKHMNRCGTSHSESVKSKISNSLKKYKKTKNHCNNISSSLIGRTISWKTNTHIYSESELKSISERTLGENNPMYGKHHTDDWKEAHSIYMKNYYKNNDNYWKGKSWDGERLENLKNSLKNQPKVVCEYCNKLTTKGNYARWHGKKCKEIK
jgi:hypothetical protein